MARRTGKKGGKKGNGNALSHGAYRDLRPGNLDGRTKVAKTIAQIESSLAASVGGDPSPQQVMLIQRAAIKAVRCSMAETVIFDENPSESLVNDYLKWAKELRMDLQALGLERRARDVTPNIHDYLKANGDEVSR